MLGLGVVAAVLVLVMAGVSVADAVSSRGQAQSAADLGALAGAAALRDTPAAPGEACRIAQEIVEANHAVVTGCQVQGSDVRVTAEAPLSVLPGLTASARARAGPVRAGSAVTRWGA